MIRFESDGLVGECTIDRLERRNALDAAHADDLRAAIEGAVGLRAIVLTGAGSTFCAGADLDARLYEANEGARDAFRPAFEQLGAAMRAFPGVIIAAVDGPAFGAGTQLVVFSDVAVVGDDAELAIPAGRLGVHLSAAAIARLVAVVGIRTAEDLLLAGRVFNADDAVRDRFAQYRVPRALERARELAHNIASQAPLSIAGHKASIAQFNPLLTDAQREVIRGLEQRAFASDDFREGLAARAERRPPRFTGQ